MVVAYNPTGAVRSYLYELIITKPRPVRGFFIDKMEEILIHA